MEHFKTILIMITAFLFIYLLGAFYSATFNISNWSNDVKFTVTFTGGAACLICLMLNKIKI